MISVDTVIAQYKQKYILIILQLKLWGCLFCLCHYGIHPSFHPVSTRVLL